MTVNQRPPGAIALLGYLVESFEAAKRLGYDFVAVVPPGFDTHLKDEGIQAIPWDFERINERSADLAATLQDMGVRLAIPLYEETVEWAGALNARFLDNPRLFNRYWALRDKAMMKRKAQMSGIRVGVFEEVDSPEDVRKFLKRVNEAEGRIEGDEVIGVHLKPTAAAGSVGHRYIKSLDEVAEVPDDAYPCMVESHLDGQEFSCEVFVHNGEIAFMNINEYIHLGYSQLLPPTPELEAHRPRIRAEVEKLVKSFEIKNSILHPEYFLDAKGELNFGEVAARIPGGHIFDLIERAYGFDPFAGQILCSDPEVSPEEIAAFFPDEVAGRNQHAGNLLVYPKRRQITSLAIPQELEDEPYYLKHDLFEPVTSKVQDRVGFGNHYGHIDFVGDDAERLKDVLLRFEELEYYE